MSKRGSKTDAKKTEKTIIKTFRLPGPLAEALVADAQKNNRTTTELVLGVLSRYIDIDRFAAQLDLIIAAKGTIKALMDAVPDEKLREIAVSQSTRVGELAEFLFKKKDLDAIMSVVDLSSSYLRAFEYTSSRSVHSLTLTMRSALGRKHTLFNATFWEHGIAKAIGVTPEVELGENQATLIIHL